MAGYLPASEAELYRNVPGSNRPNSFPAESLLGGEKRIFETRPGLIGLHPWIFYGSLPFVVLLLLVWVVGVSQYGILSFGSGAVGFVLFLTLLPILYCVASWSRTAYALTGQRVLARAGDDYASATYDDVQEVAMHGSTIVFVLTPPPPTGRIFSPKRRELRWRAVPGAPGVAAFAKSAVNFYRLRNRQRQIRQDLTVASLQDRVVCAYCGAFVEVASISTDNPRCPRCTAPLTVAPVGF